LWDFLISPDFHRTTSQRSSVAFLAEKKIQVLFSEETSHA